MTRNRRANLICLAVYAALLAAVMATLMHARNVRLADWSQSETQARWREFQAAERKQWEDQSGPVRRRPVNTDAPADVILLRDHFGAVTGGIVATGTFLYVFLVLIIRGSLATRAPNPDCAPSQATP
ncbi:MAG TPA: hypothetical protein VGX78_04520 [Pirellulales bacterium]|jgi:hypothetical protein|nr:hypothetical protein [Pirellulales bacterium]